MSKGLKKSSKLKQKLYIKFLKNNTNRNEEIYKNFKNLFEKIKTRSKNNYYSSLLIKYKNNTKKIWNIMKEITGKINVKTNNFPKTLKTNEGLITDDNHKMAKEFNKYFTNIGPNLAEKIPNVEQTFKDYLPIVNTKMNYEELSTA